MTSSWQGAPGYGASVEHAGGPPRQGWKQSRLLIVVVALVVAVVSVVVAFALTRSSSPSEDDTLRPVNVPAKVLGVVGAPYPSSWPVWGFTHTDYSADVGPASQVAAGPISQVPMLQNQHIMGWGAGNPEPSPGRYDFAAFDRRMNYIRSTKGIPIITLCCAPDWMKGGPPGATDMSKLEVAPTPDHYQDFARLAAEVVKRNPDVKYYAVWNELKGFYDKKNNRWQYENYTNLYNAVYDAIKAVNPDVKVGGPYIPVYSFARGKHSDLKGKWGSVDQNTLDAIGYWLDRKHGADFIAVDGPSATDDRDIVPDEFTALDKFSAVNAWLRSKTDLPIWWNEYYVEPETFPWKEDRRVAVHAAAMINMARSGVVTSLYWNNEAQDGRCEGCLWISTLVRDGGRPGPMLGLFQNLTRYFPAGTEMLDVRASSSKVRVLAQAKKILVVNTSDDEVTTYVGPKKITLDDYEVRWLDR